MGSLIFISIQRHTIKISKMAIRNNISTIAFLLLLISFSLSCYCWHNNCNNNPQENCTQPNSVCFGIYDLTKTTYNNGGNWNETAQVLNAGCTTQPDSYKMGCNVTSNIHNGGGDTTITNECTYICNYSYCNSRQAMTAYFTTIARSVAGYCVGSIG